MSFRHQGKLGPGQQEDQLLVTSIWTPVTRSEADSDLVLKEAASHPVVSLTMGQQQRMF